MDPKRHPHAAGSVWDLARAQHGVATRRQLLALGLGPDSIKHRVQRGRLHPLHRGVYAVGRPELSPRGRWMAAVLSCGPGTLLSHRSAATLWGIVRTRAEPEIDVTVPRTAPRRRPGIRVHRRNDLGPEHCREVANIPLTDPVSTLVDLASCSPEWQVERAINEADRLDLVGPEALRVEVERHPPRPGIACVRRLIGCEELTDSGLERKLLGIVRAANLPPPETQAQVNGYRVDFYWPELGLVVEADGWRYHRTSFDQVVDHRRDQVHAAAGLTTLRFAEDQIRYSSDEVAEKLTAVIRQLSRVKERSLG